jgi:tetratricopeptide (TPR) repeat protein
LADGHALLGLALGTCNFDWTAGEQEFRGALQLDPASPDIHYLAFLFLLAAGRIEEAGIEMRRAVEQDPLSPHLNAMLGFWFCETGRHDQAIAQCRLAVELDPDFWLAHWMFALSYLYKGQLDDAISIAEEGIRVCGRYSMLLMCVGACYAVVGRVDATRQLLEELKARRRETYVPPFAIATLHLALGEVDQGLEWLATAVEERDLTAISTLKSDSFYAPLRPHQAFQALLRKMNLAP